jgi:hypothetical protein
VIEELSLPVFALPANESPFQGASLETALLATDFKRRNIHSDLSFSRSNRFTGEVETLRYRFHRVHAASLFQSKDEPEGGEG